MALEQRPPCPYCGEHQSYDEARPSKPIVFRDYQVVRGRLIPTMQTRYDTHCRACDQRIVYGVEVATWNGKEMDESHAGEASWSKWSQS